jgi:Zn-dependent protease
VSTQEAPPTPSPASKTRPGSFRVGRLAGVPIFISYSWIIVAVVIIYFFQATISVRLPGLGNSRWVGAITFVLLFYASVFLHEAAHTLVAKAFGMKVLSIVLHFFGGFSEIEGESTSPWKSLAVAVAGPVVSIALGTVYFAYKPLEDSHPLLSLVLFQLGVSNLFVGLFNLLPGLPLDGGHILESLVWGITGKRHVGMTVAGWSGRFFALVVVAVPLFAAVLSDRGSDFLIYLVWGFLLSGTLWVGATAGLHAARIRRVLPSLTARTLARPAIGVPGDLPLSEVVARATTANVKAVVVLDHAGAPNGLVSEAALEAVPEERRPWVAVSSVTRQLEDGLLINGELEGEALLNRLSGLPAGEYLVVDKGNVVLGVLSARDVNAKLG